MDTIRIGIAGLGHRARGAWAPALRKMPGYRITALYDWIEPLHAKTRPLLQHPEEVTSYTDWSAFLADPNIDAVALCVRQPDQGAMAAQALEAGKHVTSEVPAAHSIADCWRIVLAAERTGKVYFLAEQVRYCGYVDAWRKLVREGRLGKIVYCESQYIGYYGTTQFFQDYTTGAFYPLEELAAHPNAKPTWLNEMPPIHYLPHELSPMLKVLDDRVTEVTAMSTRQPSYVDRRLGSPDMQVALMRTEKDTLLRMAAGFNIKGPPDDHHWNQLLGTEGRVEWRRTPKDRPKLWIAGEQMHQAAEMDWRYERSDAPDEARQSGHWGLDYYVHAPFREAVLRGTPPEFDLYQAMDTAAPAILAAESIARGSIPLPTPDFRPNAQRRKGYMIGE